MIVPENRLIALTAAVLLPAAAVGGLVPGAAPAMAAAALALAAVAVLDAALSLRTLDAVAAGFGAPGAAAGAAVFRMTAGREGALMLWFEQRGGRARTVRVGLSLPPAAGSAQDVHAVTLPAAGPGRFAWPCTPAARGRHAVRGIHLETPSRLGLWALRARREAAAELRVYPSLERARKRLAAVFLHRGGFGIHQYRRIGKGRDFEQLREYIPGDGYDDIHWKATARRGRPATKMYQVERTQEVYAVIDASRPAARRDGATGESHLERAIEAALTLALVAERQGDRFGLAVYGEGLERFVRAGRGKAHYQVCRDALYTLAPGDRNAGYLEVFTALRLRLRQRALLLFLTHLDDPALAGEFAQHAGLLARRHLVLAETVTPPALRPVFSAPAAAGEDLYGHVAGHLRWHELRELQRRVQRENVTLRMVEHAALTPDAVSQYLAIKQRQAL